MSITQSFLNERSAKLYISRENDLEKRSVIAWSLTRELLGNSVSLNKRHIPWYASYLYQVGDMGSNLNDGLRLGTITRFLHESYATFISYFKESSPVNHDVVVFRGISSKDIPQLAVNDLFDDKAFNSVSLDPKQAAYFGDALFIIRLTGQRDKLLYIGGHKDFYAETYECLLPCGTQYKVVEILTLDVIGSKTCYVVETVESTVPSHPIINNSRDDEYVRMTTPFVTILQNNEDRNRFEQTAVVDADNFYWYLSDIGHSYTNDILYKEILEAADDETIIIIKTMYLYRRFCKGNLYGMSTLVYDKVANSFLH